MKICEKIEFFQPGIKRREISMDAGVFEGSHIKRDIIRIKCHQKLQNFKSFIINQFFSVKSINRLYLW